MASSAEVPLLDFVGPQTLADEDFELSDGETDQQAQGRTISDLPAGKNIIPSARPARRRKGPVHAAAQKTRFNRKVIVDEDHALNIEDFADFDIITGHYEPEQLMILLHRLHDKYIQEGLDQDSLREHAYAQWGLKPDMPPNCELVYEEYQRNIYQAMRLYQQFVDLDLVNAREDEHLNNMRTFAKIFEAISTMYELLMAEHRLVGLCNPDNDIHLPDEVQIFKFSFFDYSKNNPFQNLLLYLLGEAYRKRYRRYGDKCYKQVQTPEGYATHAWNPVCNIFDFVQIATRKETNYNMWCAMTSSRGNDKAAAQHLTVCQDVEFPELKPDRHIFSFRNGLYFAQKNEFFPYNTAPVPDSVIACKYFDVVMHWEEYTQYEHWYDIPTPDFQSILDYQELPRDACILMYALIGRLIYFVSENDEWQVLPFIKGVANSGKSTIGKTVHYFYNTNDVGIMSSNIEKKFGLAALYNKWLFICYEVREDFGLTQAELQSMISGEDVSIPIKHKEAVAIRWNVPGIFMGNEIAKWVDAAGSMSRRILLFLFNKVVTKSDPGLTNRIKKEIAALLYKCNSAYQCLVKEHGGRGIDEWMPDYFKQTQLHLISCIDSLYAFVENADTLVQHETYYMPLNDLRDMYMQWCKDTGYVSKPWSIEYYSRGIDKLGWSLLNHETKMYRGKTQTCRWVVGVGPVDEYGIFGAGASGVGASPMLVAAQPQSDAFDIQPLD